METLLSFDKVYKDYPSGPSIIHALKETNFEAKKGRTNRDCWSEWFW